MNFIKLGILFGSVMTISFAQARTRECTFTSSDISVRKVALGTNKAEILVNLLAADEVEVYKYNFSQVSRTSGVAGYNNTYEGKDFKMSCTGVIQLFCNIQAVTPKKSKYFSEKKFHINGIVCI